MGSPLTLISSEKEAIHLINSQFGGLVLFNTFWKEQHFGAILDKEVSKKSGADFSDIIKNVICGHIIGYDSLEDLTDKTLKEDIALDELEEQMFGDKEEGLYYEKYC